ncbi:MAG: O-antigen ligase family protein, partial [Pseudomonadota bacterium]
MKQNIAKVLIGLAAFLLPVALLLSHRNFTIILGLIGLAGLGTVLQRTPPRWTLWLFGLMAYGAVTCIWSPSDEAYAWPGFLLALGGLTYSAMGAGDRQLSTYVLVAAGFAIVLLGFEAVTGGLLRDITPPKAPPNKDDIATARGITAALYLAPAVLLVLVRYQRWLSALLVLSSVCVAAFAFGIFANTLAFILAVLAAGFTYWRPRYGLRLLIVCAVFGFIAMPLSALALPSVETLLTYEAGPATWRIRLVIWKVVTQSMAEHPLHLLFGNGIESVRVLGDELGMMSVPGALHDISVVPTHPHNVFLQVWYELGLVGCVLSIITLWKGGQVLVARITT